jgi:glutaredoxin
MRKLEEIFTDKKFLTTCSLIFGSVFLILLGVYVYLFVIKDHSAEENITEKPEGLMLMIEFEDTVGLNNFVFQMNQRDIPGLLMVNAEYVEQNCELVKGLQQYDIEIAGVAPGEPFWDLEYDVQYERMGEVKERIEACTGQPVRVMGSKYFAYDENTLRAADALGIPYVFARGTTGSKATIYQPEEYEAKIFSVSNIDSPKWGTGSLCDYSYWAREGNPQDFKDEVYKAFENFDKVSPVSHTYIGGAKERWNEVYVDMFDNLEVNWVTLDEFGEVDVYASVDDIPVNREVQYTTPKPEIPLEEETEVDNPCAVIETEKESEDSSESTNIEEEELVMFHNGSGPMCLEAIDFLEENNIEYTEYLTTDENFEERLEEYKEEYGETSEGVSNSYGYYPMIFYKGRSFSGFNDEIATILENL